MYVILKPSSNVKNLTAHTIMAFAAGPSQTQKVLLDSRGHGVLDSTFDKGQIIVFQWFADSNDSDGLVAQNSIASGSTSSEGILSLYDSDGTELGTLTVTSPELTGPPKALPESSHDPGQLIAKVTQAHKEFGASFSKTLADVDMVLDKKRSIPLLIHALSAMEFFNPERIVPLFTYFAYLAEHILVQKPTSLHQLLVDTLSIITLGWVYRFDINYKGNSTDQWSTILSFPNYERAAFDCEDGAKVCMTLFLAFTKASLRLVRRKGSSLHALQELALQYTPYMGVVELKDPDKKDYGAHCFLILKSSQPGAQPTLTVEPTAFGSCVWTSGSVGLECVERDEPGYRKISNIISNTNLGGDARLRLPLSLIHKEKMYGRLYSMFTASAKGDRCEHLVFQGKDGEFGVDANDYFLHGDSACQSIKKAINLPTFEAQRLLAFALSLIPKAIIPLAPSQFTRLDTAPRIILSRPRTGAFEIKITDKMTVYGIV